jgi:alginate O-acetyltransferase complex protein AlgI
MDILGRLFASGGTDTMVTALLVFTIVAMIASQFVPEKVSAQAETGFSRLAPVFQIGVIALGLLLIDALGPEGIAPFIYFQF